VILVTTGTNGAAFDRLIRAVQQLDAVEITEEIVVQCGASTLRPVNATCVDYVSYDDLVALVREARVVVSHGGVGSILVALTQGKRPLVVPRQREFGEVVDDHQLLLARRLARDGLIGLVENPDDLGTQLAAHDAVSTARTGANRGLAEELSLCIDLIVGAGSRER
jgi:UDP-N-acetylglucosamine transferase subunit ALG13